MTLFPTDNWRAGMQDVSAAIDETMGELVKVVPCYVPKVNFPSEAQYDKAVTVVAVFKSPHTYALGGEHQRSGLAVSPLVSTRKPVFEFGYGVLPFRLQQYFRIIRLCNREMFEVTDIRPDGVSRIECGVKQLGRQKEER